MGISISIIAIAMPRLCRLLLRELQKIACLATVHYLIH